MLANLIIAGGGVLFRAAAQAYRQALQNAQRSGVAQDAAQAGRGAARRREVGLEEARDILGLEGNESFKEVEQKYSNLMEKNDRLSFYIQSKVYRAYERLKSEEEPHSQGEQGSRGENERQA